MNTYLMKKAMIETAVSRGIKEMEEDPKRSVRRLVDLGKQFSKNRFQDEVFTVMQELLDNEDSSYYDMLSNLLRNSDHEAMKKFGVNFGYMGWTYGAGQIRKEEKEKGFCIPWTIMLQYDPASENGFSIEELASLMEQGMDMGIYTYFIRECGGGSDSYELLDLLDKYKDAAFLWVRENGRLTAAQVQMLKLCRNTVVSLPIEDRETLLTAELLRDQKIIYAMHMSYDDTASGEAISSIMENVLTSETALFFLIAQSGTSRETCQATRKFCYDSRLRQQYPCCLMDYYGDAISISNVVVEHPNIFEIGSDKKIIWPREQQGQEYDAHQSLEENLRRLMPVFVPKEEA